MGFTKVTGLGAACSTGLEKEKIFDSCLQGESAVGHDGLASISEDAWKYLFASAPETFRKSKCTVLSFCAVKEALDESGWTQDDLSQCGFIFASTTSQIDQWEKKLPFYKNISVEKIESGVADQSLGSPLFALAEYFGIGGPKTLFSSSCSASLQALSIANLWIKSGKVKRCLVGATELNNDLTKAGFGSLRLLSKTNACPFDKNRSGINLGEGSAFLCLEDSSLASTPSWGFIRGIGLGSDAYHPTAPHPEGRGSRESMTMALREAHVDVLQVPWIYAHGTGSIANDLSEAKAIESLFPQSPLVSSTKSLHGHTLGACGVLESCLGLMAMQRSQILPTFNFKEADPKMNIQVCGTRTEKNFSTFLKNSLGFGGINVSILFAKHLETP
ncbi:MAG: beta-ketoacyl-[acyl-carrier-protein] synthase family protein [Pseudobdellovibrionaceae bacterium]